MALVKVKGSAWRLDLGNNSDKHVYTMQIDGINGKNEDKIANTLMKDWRLTGYIVPNSESGAISLLYQKDFSSDQEWHNWAKSSFGYPLEEIGMRSDKVKILVKSEKKEKKEKVKKAAKKTRKSGKRICRQCGKPGHNARTCGTEKVVAASKKLKQCTYCGGFGHNKRTCKEYKKTLV